MAAAVIVGAGGGGRGAFSGVAGSNQTGGLGSGVTVVVGMVRDMSASASLRAIGSAGDDMFVAAGLRAVSSAGEEGQDGGVPVVGDGTHSSS